MAEFWNVKRVWALDPDGEFVHARSAQSEVTCPGCGKALSPRRGDTTRSYFAHRSGSGGCSKHTYAMGVIGRLLQRAADRGERLHVPAADRHGTFADPEEPFGRVVALWSLPAFEYSIASCDWGERARQSEVDVLLTSTDGQYLGIQFSWTPPWRRFITPEVEFLDVMQIILSDDAAQLDLAPEHLLAEVLRGGRRKVVCSRELENRADQAKQRALMELDGIHAAFRRELDEALEKAVEAYDEGRSFEELSVAETPGDELDIDEEIETLPAADRASTEVLSDLDAELDAELDPELDAALDAELEAELDDVDDLDNLEETGSPRGRYVRYTMVPGQVYWMAITTGVLSSLFTWALLTPY